MLQRKAKFAVIFAAGLLRDRRARASEREQRLAELVRERRRAPARPEHEPQRVRRLPRRSRRPVDRARSRSRATRAGRCSRARRSASGSRTGRRPATRSTSSSPTSRATSPTSPKSASIACYIEGFKDGRTLMLAADHAARLRKPIVMVKVGKTDDRPVDGAVAHRPPHRLRRGDLGGVPPVRRDARRRPRRAARSVDGVRRARPARRSRPTCGDGRRRPPACASTRSRGGTGAHMADVLADAGLRAPRPHQGVAAAAARRVDPRVPARVEPGRLRRPAGRRRARPQDPRRHPRRPERRHPRHPDHGRGRRCSASRSPATSSRSRRPTTKPIFVVWGAPAGTDDTYYKRLLDGGLPVFRTFNNCVKAVKAYVDYWTFAARYRRRSPTRRPSRCPAARKARKLLAGAAAGRGAVASGSRSRCCARTASRRRATCCARRPRRRCARRKAARLPGRDEGRRRPTCCTRPKRASCRSASSRPRTCARRTTSCCARRSGRTASARIDGVMVCEMVTGGVDTLIGVSHRRTVRPGRHVRAGRHLRRGVRRRDVPRSAVRRGRGPPHARRAAGLRAAARACAARSRPTSTRSSTRS